MAEMEKEMQAQKAASEVSGYGVVRGGDMILREIGSRIKKWK